MNQHILNYLYKAAYEQAFIDLSKRPILNRSYARNCRQRHYRYLDYCWHQQPHLLISHRRSIHSY